MIAWPGPSAHERRGLREPAVVAVAEDFIRHYTRKKRLSVLAGNYLRDGIGTGYDFIWACSILNFARQTLDATIAKLFEALNPGGVLVSLQHGMTDEQTRPDMAKATCRSRIQQPFALKISPNS